MQKLTPTNTVFVIMDVQEKLTPKLHSFQSMIRQCQKALQLAGHLHIPVMTSEQLPDKLGPTVSELSEYLTEPPMIKQAFSSWNDPNQQNFFIQCHRPNIVLFGAETHICVTLTARDLKMAGFSPVVCADATSARELAQHQQAISNLQAFQIWTPTFETIAYDLITEAGTDQFRQLLPLFK